NLCGTIDDISSHALPCFCHAVCCTDSSGLHGFKFFIISCLHLCHICFCIIIHLCKISCILHSHIIHISISSITHYSKGISYSISHVAILCNCVCLGCIV